MLADVILTRHVTSSGVVQMTEFDEILGRHSRHFYNLSARVGRHVILGGQAKQHNANISN